MKKMIYLKLLSLFLISFCMNSHAESNPVKNLDLTTAKLNQACNLVLEDKTRELSFNQGLCIGIVLGVEDNAHYDKKICIPNSIDIKDRLSVIKSYVQTQPKRMKEAYASLVFDALAQRWPCLPN
jgi:Rap1a immunity proteins